MTTRYIGRVMTLRSSMRFSTSLASPNPARGSKEIARLLSVHLPRTLRHDG